MNDIKRTYYIYGAVDKALQLNKPPVPFDGYFENFIKFEVNGMNERYCDGKAILDANNLCEQAKWNYTSTIETYNYPDNYMPDYISSLYYFGEDKSVWIVGGGKLRFIRIGFTDKTPEEYLTFKPPEDHTLRDFFFFFLGPVVTIVLYMDSSFYGSILSDILVPLGVIIFVVLLNIFHPD